MISYQANKNIICETVRRWFSHILSQICAEKKWHTRIVAISLFLAYIINYLIVAKIVVLLQNNPVTIIYLPIFHVSIIWFGMLGEISISMNFHILQAETTPFEYNSVSCWIILISPAKCKKKIMLDSSEILPHALWNPSVVTFVS